MRVHSRIPASILTDAHLRYPQAVAERGLYCVAFFRHSRPSNLAHKETTESVWRGLVRRIIRERAS